MIERIIKSKPAREATGSHNGAQNKSSEKKKKIM